MARCTTISLGHFSISSYLDKNFVLAVETSVTLSLPDGHHAMSAADLRGEVRAGSLWVTRAGSCRFELSVGFEGLDEDGLREDLEHRVIRAFESLEAWEALGIDVRREYSGFHTQPGSSSPYPYALYHDSQNSGLVAPDEVPCASVSTVACNLSFGTKRLLQIRDQAEPKARPHKRTKIVTLRLSSRKLRRFAARKRPDQGLIHQHRASLEKKSTTDKRKVSNRQAQQIFGDAPDIYDLSPDLREKRLEHLTHVALNLLLGSRKRFIDVKFVERINSPTLLDIAPAVWNARYFQEVASRVRLAPFISSALGNLINSDSPLLRQKVDNLAPDPTEELHRQTSLLILRSTRVPKTKQTTLRPQIASGDAIFNLQTHDGNDFHDQGFLDPTREPPGRDLSHVGFDVDDTEAAAFTTAMLRDDDLPYGKSLEFNDDPHPGQSLPLAEQATTTDSLGNRFSLDGFQRSSQFVADAILDDRCQHQFSYGVSMEQEECEPQHYSALHETEAKLVEDKVVDLFEEPAEAPLRSSERGLYDDDLLTIMGSYGCHEETYLEAEQDRARLLALESPFATGNFRHDAGQALHSTAEQELAKFLASRCSSTELQDYCNTDIEHDIVDNEAITYGSFGEAVEDYRVDSMSICSSEPQGDDNTHSRGSGQACLYEDEEKLGEPFEENAGESYNSWTKDGVQQTPQGHLYGPRQSAASDAYPAASSSGLGIPIAPLNRGGQGSQDWRYIPMSMGEWKPHTDRRTSVISEMDSM